MATPGPKNDSNKYPRKAYFALEMSDRSSRRSDSSHGGRSEERDTLDEDFDEVFWRKVRDKYNESEMSWSRAMDEVRVEQLVEKYESSGNKLSEIPLLVLLKRWPTKRKYRDSPSLLAALEHQINRFTAILLENESGVDYKYFRDKEDPAHKTLLHLAAALGYSSVCKTILNKYPGQLYITTRPHNEHRRYLPVELALMKEHDGTAAFLVKQMKHERVRHLFLCNHQENPDNFSFNKLVEGQRMEKTVVAVLDCMITPHYPYLPERRESYESREDEENIEHAWNSVPDEPMSYQFYYQILDGDEWGRLPTVPAPRAGESTVKNRHFNWKTKSSLYSIAYSGNKEAIQHPVVRLLIKKKWKDYAHMWFCTQAGFYTAFLLLLSYALIHGCTRDNPNRYNGAGDWVRQACEICAIVMVVAYIIDEINQLEKERLSYFRDVYNYFDWLGLLLLLLVIPFRFADNDHQWLIAAVGYFFNFLRIFKFSCVTRTTGLYTKTLAKIIYRDMTRFGVVFLIVFLAFCGTFFMSLRATGNHNVFGGYNLVLLSGVRALVEQQGPIDDFTKYRWLPTVVVLIYMAAVVVILLNILIAQLSSTYAEAKKIARLQYDIDRMHIITRLEHSRFYQLNLRLMHFKEEEWIDEIRLAKELLEYSEDRHPWESIEDKLEAIRTMMKKVIKKFPLPSESKH
ncbi:uncharacterized protein LOC5507682 [Nematostella vectensis]|uniref:uncharacterized protein LOC5507682 n=1 Tax=Nematostella vectensis TaxID=45351 RepID=UPI002077415D|nr:uncharacterized protein LOC5507682 [Nematostella vectensis]